MWWAGRPVADIYLGERLVALCTSSGTADGASLPSLKHRETEGIADALRQMTELLETLPRHTEVQLWLSGGLCRPFLMGPVADLRNDIEQRRAATVLARQWVNFEGPVKLWLEPSSSKRTHRVAVASSTEWVDGALASCAAVRRRVRCLRPWWASVLNGSIDPSSAWSAISAIDSDAMIVFAGDHDGFDVVETLHPMIETASARAHLARTLIEFDRGAAPADLLCLDLTRRADSPLPCAFGDWVHRVA